MSSAKSWPIGIAIIYISFVLLLVAFVIFSSFQKVDLVTEDYYSAELEYQQQINRMNRAQKLSEPVHWTYDNNSDFLTVEFPVEFDPHEVKGHIHFFRPSDASQDKRTSIILTSENTQQISTKNLASGLWKLKIFWHVGKTEYYKEGILFVE
jgi:hypothetical protein